MLNALINLDGLKTGFLVNRGFEDMIVQGRGSQTSSIATGPRSCTCSTANTAYRW